MRSQFLQAGLLAGVVIFGSAVSTYAANVSIGGGSGSVASVSSGPAANTSTTANIGNTSGPLATATSDGSTSNANVNLGAARGNGQIANTINGLLNGVDNGGLGAGGVGAGGGLGAGGAQVAAVVSGMSTGDRAALRARCGDIMATPGAFDSQLVSLCRILAKLH